MSEWMPIESAPRDGTVVDLWAEGHRWANMHWSKDTWCHSKWAMFRGRGKSYPYTRINSYTDLPASHWMPAPAPPANKMEK